MYLDHFGLHHPPFDNIPNPSFFYASDVHKEALAALIYGIQNQKGIILITGGIGTGKTLLVRKLREQLPESATLLEFEAPGLRPRDIHQRLAKRLGVKLGDMASREDDFNNLKKKLHQICRKGHKVVLLFDEAQDLSDKTLNSIRRLSNLDVEGERLLQIVLLGQMELLHRLQAPALRALLQRVALHRSLSNLTQAETIEYITYRCQKAGAPASLFSPEAMQLVYQASSGAPRMINHMCDNALLAGYADGLTHIEAPTIREVITQLPFITAVPPAPPPPKEPASASGEKTENIPSTSGARTPDGYFGAAPSNKSWLWLGGTLLLGYLVFVAYDSYHSEREPIPRESLAVPSPEDTPAQRVRMPSTVMLPPLPDADQPTDEGTDEDLADLSLDNLLDLPTPENEPQNRPTGEQGTRDNAARTLAPSAKDGRDGSLPRLADKPENIPATLVETSDPLSNPVSPGDAPVSPPAAKAIGNATMQPTPRQLPLPAFSDAAPQDRIVHVMPGQLLSKIAAEHYGLWTSTIRDIIRAANPHLRDLDALPKGARVRLPQVTARRLIIEHKGAFYVYLRTVFGQQQASRFAAQLSNRGESVIVVADQDNRSLYRIYLGPYLMRQDAEQTSERIHFSPWPELR